MKKILTIILIIYLSAGFVFAIYAYNDSLKTFDCTFPAYMKYQNVGMGGFYTNPYPEFCIRRGFTLGSIIMIPVFTAMGIPMLTAKYILR